MGKPDENKFSISYDEYGWIVKINHEKANVDSYRSSFTLNSSIENFIVEEIGNHKTLYEESENGFNKSDCGNERFTISTNYT